MLEYGLLLVGEAGLNDHRLLHKIICDPAYQEIWDTSMWVSRFLLRLLLLRSGGTCRRALVQVAGEATEDIIGLLSWRIT